MQPKKMNLFISFFFTIVTNLNSTRNCLNSFIEGLQILADQSMGKEGSFTYFALQNVVTFVLNPVYGLKLVLKYSVTQLAYIF